jgi:alanine-glyoxylate transaminase/(R)-3-amino-2-methylpropionate-pyruvate transaminase
MNYREQGYRPLETSWSYEGTEQRRTTFLSPSLRTFQAYGKPLVLKRGQGQYLWDVHEKKYVDLMAQNLCISVGYNHPLVNSEVKKQIDLMAHCTTMYLQPVPAHFAEELVDRMPAGTDWVVHFVSSGSEAIDLAVLMARVFTGNYEIVALRNCYHGLQFSAMALTGIQSCRQAVPPAQGIVHVPNPDPYRGIFGATVDPYVDEIKRSIMASTPGRIAGFIAEPIQGFGGVIPLPGGYLAAAFEQTRAAGGVCMVDEVQTGFARTGAGYWGFQSHDVRPDIVVLGKGIGNGFPLSAVVARREIAEAMAHKKFFNTYGSNPVSCAAGRAVLRAVDEDQIQDNARDVGAYLKDRLMGLQSRYELVGDVRGSGLMIGVELVKNRQTKEPADEAAGRVAEDAKNNGLIIGKGGVWGNVLRINPPMCIQKHDIDFAVDVLDQSLSGCCDLRTGRS